MDDINRAFDMVREKINERESTYLSTWREVPTYDLVSAARLKTYRATTCITTKNKEKLKDDIEDAIAYLLFALAKVEDERKI